MYLYGSSNVSICVIDIPFSRANVDKLSAVLFQTGEEPTINVSIFHW